MASELLDFLSNRTTSLDRLIRFRLVTPGDRPGESLLDLLPSQTAAQRAFRDKPVPSGERANKPSAKKEDEVQDPTSFTFRINPGRLKISRPKIEKYLLTKNGFERNFWHNDLIRFEYEGSSGVFRPEDRTWGFQRFDITTTLAWQKFRQFEKFYQLCDDRNVQMTYWGYPHAYDGSLNDFTFNYDPEKNPNMITYNFKYTALPLKYTDVTVAFATTSP